MANNRLVTEVRVNKNGVSVRKRVRADGGGKPASTTMPQPRINVAQADQKRREQLIDDIDTSQGNDSYRDRVAATVSDMPMSMVRAAQAQIDRYPDSRRIGATVESAITKWDEKYEGDGLRRLAIVAVQALYEKHEKKSPLGNPIRCFDILDSVSNHLDPEGEYAVSFEGTPEIGRDSLALVYFVAASDLHMRNSGERFVSHHENYALDQYPELAEVFLEFHDRAEELAEYVIENGRDAGRARQHMRGEPLIFADGSL